MRHGDIWAIEDTVIALPVYLETEDLQHFLSELIKCRSQLEKLYQLELPLPENTYSPLPSMVGTLPFSP